MSPRHRPNIDLKDPSNVSLSSSWQSKPFLLEALNGASFQLACIGAVVGTFTMQASDDNGSDIGNPVIVNWTDETGSAFAVGIASTPTMIAVGGVGNASSPLRWNFSVVQARWARVAFVPGPGGSSGT